MTEIVIAIGAKVAEYLVAPISRHVRYLLCFNQFIGDVENSKKELEVKLGDIKQRKEEADRKFEAIIPSVKEWLRDVQAILEDVQELQHEVEEGAAKKCFNVRRRYPLAKKMDDKANRMKELKQDSNNLEPFSLPIQLPGMLDSSKDFVEFNSRKSAYNDLLEAIEVGKNKIGLFGSGGSGKTTLATKVGDTVKQLKRFDKEIKELAGLEIKEETQSAVAQRLLMGLKSMKILIILDDVWIKLNLEEIGIPLNEGCRVLLTTRRRDVCDSMDCESIIELSILKEEEAWDLFKRHANIANVSTNDEFDGIGKKIAEECKGLPIAIVTLGSMLKGKSLQVWESTLRRLRNPTSSDIEKDLEKGLYAVLEISYDNLPTKLAKSLFLLCSMFPEDHDIHVEDLIRFGKGTLELDDGVYTMEDTRKEILVAIERLLDYCLLMPANKKACVKLHDVVPRCSLVDCKENFSSSFGR
ncbi:disease resistance protein At4g27190-like [Prosopis cineraria]|uniref:disease resistance protein At4g27190-like n=1 Tax=Prosopis cineraria TaxID=364024 RepID=UPI00240FA9B1|nr:disease resistance protein At4g27190-like [Prosopis cineraria]